MCAGKMNKKNNILGLYPIRATFKDPVHGLIPVNELEYKIIQHPIFLRLHGIKQLGFTYMVYPQAKHSRFEHSLGSMHIANILLEAFRKSNPKLIEKLTRDKYDYRYLTQLVRLLGLLHDIGHLPYSHVTENTLEKLYYKGKLHGKIVNFIHKAKKKGKKLHEEIACYLVKRLFEDKNIATNNTEKALGKSLLKSLCDIDSPEWKEIFTDKAIELAKEMISGKITDIDRMDYLVRDAHNTGATYGIIDISRLANGLSIKEYNDKIIIFAPAKLLSNIEELYYSRYMMYKWVYLHHKVGAIEIAYEETLLQVSEHWEKIKNKLKHVPNLPKIFWDIFTPENIWKYTTKHDIKLDDAFMDSVIMAASNTLGSRTKYNWPKMLLQRKIPLKPVVKRQEVFLTRLARIHEKGRKLHQPLIKKGQLRLKKLVENIESNSSHNYRVLESKLENYLNNSLRDHGVKIKVHLYQPIKSKEYQEPYIDVEGEILPINQVSMLISLINEVGDSPIIYVYVLAKKKKIDKNVRDLILKEILFFLEKPAGKGITRK